MNTNRQILIDKKILRWVAWLLNICVTIAGKIAPKNHDLSLPFRKIAVCKFKGLGSIIQATALLQTLRNNYPDARIIFISTIANKSILEKITLIDEIVLLRDKSFKDLFFGFLPFVFKLFRAKIDVYIDLEVYSNFSSIVTGLSNAQNRFGYYQKESSYKMGIYTHMMYYNNAVPIYQTYLQWARLLHCRELSTELYHFHSDLSSLEFDEEIFSLHEKYIVINPNASDLRIERRWPAAYFTELIERLLIQLPDVTFLLIGSGSERSYVSSIAPAHARVKNIAGKTSIEALIALVQNAMLMITNDTGPMHLAFAMNVRTVALFGPCAPEQYGLHSHAVIIYKNVYCSPCVHEFRIPPCMGNNQCMKQIPVQEVFVAACELMAGNVDAHVERAERRFTASDADYEILGMIKRKAM